jgi:hypothetical protein
MPGGRPKGAKRCSDCATKRIKCVHAATNLKRKTDEITASEAKKVVIQVTKKTKRRRGELKAASVVRNVHGKNQWTSKKLKSSASENESPINIIAFSVGKNDLGSKRLAKKIVFEKSPSKLSEKRKVELVKVSKATALKALSCISSNSESVFSLMCDAELSKSTKKDAPIHYSSEINSMRLALTKATSSFQKKRILSIIALGYSYRNIRKLLGLEISRYMYTEAVKKMFKSL